MSTWPMRCGCAHTASELADYEASRRYPPISAHKRQSDAARGGNSFSKVSRGTKCAYYWSTCDKRDFRAQRLYDIKTLHLLIHLSGPRRQKSEYHHHYILRIILIIDYHPFPHRKSYRANTYQSHYYRQPKMSSATSEKSRQRSDANRDAKVYLHQIVKTDWEYKDECEPEVDESRVLEWGERNTTVEEEDPEEDEALQRRRRWEGIREEMEWNEGLRMWMARRDAWTGAQKGKRMVLAKDEKTKADEATKKSRGKSKRSSSGSADLQARTREEGQDSRPSSLCMDPEGESLVPRMQPYLNRHNNPIAASITPSVYPAIFSRVVIQSTSPTVPINLRDMTHALVQGWIDNKEWPLNTVPPQQDPEPPAVSKERKMDKARRISGNFTNAMKKALNIGSRRSSTNAEDVDGRDKEGRAE